jgi:hypothetical protein
MRRQVWTVGHGGSRVDLDRQFLIYLTSQIVQAIPTFGTMVTILRLLGGYNQAVPKSLMNLAARIVGVVGTDGRG